MRALRSSQVSPAMSAGTNAFDAVHNRPSASAGAPFALRLKVFVTRGRLDRQLAAGHPYEGVAELALRARQLTDPRAQREIARNLRGIVDYVERRGSRRVISSVVIEPGAVRRGRLAILELAGQLERAAAVNPRGIVLARTLITDGLSPLFNPHSEQTVTEAAHDVQEALEDRPTHGFDLIAA